MPAKHRLNEPTRTWTSSRVRDQPSLTTSSGTSWLVLGGLLALIAVAVLVPLIPLQPAGVAITCLAAIVVVYVGMLGARVLLGGRKRLGLLAAGMIIIALIALIGIGIVASEQWGIFR